MQAFKDDRIANTGGQLDERFAIIADVFAENFISRGELGAAFSVFQNGECVVDIYAGYADPKQEAPWREDTITCIYSSGKAVTALLIAMAVSDGKLAFDAPVAAYWPEFAQAGKDKITVAQALSHQAGLCGLPDEMPPETWLDWAAVTAKIAAMTPLWAPGTANGYHPQTVGYIAGELLRRVYEKTVGQLIAGFDLNLFCGLDDEKASRAAKMQKPPALPDLGEINDYTRLAFLTKWASAGRSTDAWRAAEIPASNMHSDAKSLALLLHAYVNGGFLNDIAILTPDAINQSLTEYSRGDDLVLPFNLSWAAGMMGNINQHFGPNEHAFGHYGFGGSVVMVDPENQLSAAYVMNRMSPHLVGDPRAQSLLDSVYSAL